MNMNKSNNLSVIGIGKIPPQSIELEEAVLGALLLEQNAMLKVAEYLKPDIFYKDSHKLIAEAILELNAKGDPVDILTVTNKLKEMGNLEVIGGAYYIAQLTQRVASSENIQTHILIVFQNYLKRKIIEFSGEIQKSAFEDTTDVFSLLDSATLKFLKLVPSFGSIKHISEISKENLKKIEDIRKAEKTVYGFASGLDDLDEVLRGFQSPNLYVIAGRPGMGKTAFIVTLIKNMCTIGGLPMAMFSLEMSSEQIELRLKCMMSETIYSLVQEGKVNEEQMNRLNDATKRISNAPLYIDDMGGISINYLRSKAMELKQTHDIKLILIDYLQLMTGDANSREVEVSHISRGVKALAKQLEIPIIILSQLNRSVETRSGEPRPKLSDLRESGAIEQDADAVIFLYRPEYYKINNIEVWDGRENKTVETEGLCELIVAKHRNGRLGDIQTTFDKKLMRFSNYEMDDTLEPPEEVSGELPF